MKLCHISSIITNGFVIVNASNVTNVIPFSEGFENGTWPFNDFYAYNANGGNTWATTSVAASQGSKSLYIYNYLKLFERTKMKC